MNAILLGYLAGVGIGLWRIDAPPMARAALALGWPIGVAAGVCTLLLLSIAALVLFPVFGAVVGAIALAAWSLW